ncbi:MAG TPA: PEP-CTERM sorting domain-containing protein [Tepidisphaeraceae bacterium]|nr:PEP-CTERM sorting domain-containing protein [Tepidisphaeraceae bacterium]
MQCKYKNKLISTLVVAGLSWGGLVASSRGAVVVWDFPTDITGDSDVSLEGAFVAAYNIGDTGVTGATVNGVTFDPFEIPNDTYGAVAHGDFRVVSQFLYSLPTVTNADFSSPNAPFTSLSADYQHMLSAGASSTLFKYFMLELGGLTVGQEYAVQLWANDSSLAYGGTEFIVFDDNEFDLGDATLDPNTTNTDGGTGQFVIGKFIAGDVTQYIGIGESVYFAGPDIGVPILNSFQLRAVPEPTSLGLLAVGVVLGLRRQSLR